jgi:hypothetical protein
MNLRVCSDRISRESPPNVKTCSLNTAAGCALNAWHQGMDVKPVSQFHEWQCFFADASPGNSVEDGLCSSGRLETRQEELDLVARGSRPAHHARERGTVLV